MYLPKQVFLGVKIDRMRTVVIIFIISVVSGNRKDRHISHISGVVKKLGLRKLKNRQLSRGILCCGRLEY